MDAAAAIVDRSINYNLAPFSLCPRTQSLLYERVVHSIN